MTNSKDIQNVTSALAARTLTGSIYDTHMVKAPVMTKAQPAWVVFSDRNEVDQIVGSLVEAKREVVDLKKIGCDCASYRKFATWQEAEAFEDKCKGY